MIRTMRWIGAFGFAALLPAGVIAQPPQGKLPAAPVKPRVAVVAEADPYSFHAATPYNPIVIGRPAPNPVHDKPNFTLECGWPNQNLDPYVHPCDCDDGHGCGSCHSGCDSCGSIFNRSSCGECGNSCGHIFNRNHCGCNDNPCGAIFRRSNCGCDSGCGRLFFNRSKCNSDCGCTNSCGCGSAAAPAAIRQTGGIEQVNWWKQRDPAPVPAAEACPNCPPAPKHRLPTAASMGCTNCGTWESERVFIFGSCRQFFGEPTHHWLHGGK